MLKKGTITNFTWWVWIITKQGDEDDSRVSHPSNTSCQPTKMEQWRNLGCSCHGKDSMKPKYRVWDHCYDNQGDKRSWDHDNWTTYKLITKPMRRKGK